MCADDQHDRLLAESRRSGIDLAHALDLVNVDDELAERAGALANRYLRSHPGVDPVDYVIAATAEYLDARLWTRNVKHFPMFPELTAPY